LMHLACSDVSITLPTIEVRVWDEKTRERFWGGTVYLYQLC
jgi:hypothetical protein